MNTGTETIIKSGGEERSGGAAKNWKPIVSPSRRALLRTSAMAIPAVVLGGCALFQSGPNQATNIQTFINAITNGTQGLENALTPFSPTPIPAAVLANAKAAISAVQSNAAAIAQEIAAGAAVHGVVQGLTALANSAQEVVNILTPFFPALTPLIGTVVQAVLVAAQTALAAAQGAASATFAGDRRASDAVSLLNSRPLAQ